MNKKVRVRFAPSPTGPLHIGGVRTALFNYLFAKKHEGDFILRIEDTDQTRLVAGAEGYINETLDWLGLIPDEGVREGGDFGPYKQSERSDIYRKFSDELIHKGWAYYAFDTPEELNKLREEAESEKKSFAYDMQSRQKLRNSLSIPPAEVRKLLDARTPFVVRFKMPESEEILINDLVRGELSFRTSNLDDKVIFKSDGLPTYHLANVVDDHLMEISHVIRGEEWLPSLPLHVMLYKALGWEKEMPKFAHLPLILKPSGKGKLSKRDGDKEGFPVFPINWKTGEDEIAAGYREAGYFPEAVLNILVMLGWNPGTDQELFSLEEMIRNFSIERVNKAGARFDPEKARWYNQQYLQKKPDKELAELFSATLDEKGIQTDLDIARVISSVRERAVFIHDIWENAYFYFEAPAEYDEKTRKKFWKEETPVIVRDCLDILRDVEDFKASTLEEKIKEYITANELGFGKVMNPLRLAIVGAAKGPHLFDILEMIGRKQTLERIGTALSKLS